MQLSNEVLIGTDGWFEYGSESPPEPPDVAMFGWADFSETDEIVPPSTGGQHWGQGEIYHYWHRRK